MELHVVPNSTNKKTNWKENQFSIWIGHISNTENKLPGFTLWEVPFTIRQWNFLQESLKL